MGSWPTLAAAVSACAVLAVAAVVVVSRRAGTRRELARLRARERALVDEIRKRIRVGHERTLARAQRAQRRIDELRRIPLPAAPGSAEAIGEELATIRAHLETALQRAAGEIFLEADAAERNLARRVLRIEGRIEILIARAEMERAERLAQAGRFQEAEPLLDDAIAKVREVRLRVAEGEDDFAFADVTQALKSAIQSVRAQAVDYRQKLERVLRASDTLLASLEAHHT
jgi:hypothetical protein